MHRSTARRLGVALTTFGLVLGLSAVAQADEPDLTVKGRVVDAAGHGITGISIYAISDTDRATLESEDDSEDEDLDDFEDWAIVQLRTTPSGRFSITDGRLSTEGWTFAFVDERKVDQPFALIEKHLTLTSPETDLGDVTLPVGAVLSGILRTKVTRTPVRDALVLVGESTKIDELDDFTDLDETSRKGAFRFTRLAPATYHLFPLFFEDDAAPSPVAQVTLTAGQVATADLTTVVPCRTSFTTKAAKKGKVTFRAAAYAPDYGVYSPRGKVTIKRGSTTVKTLTLPRSGHAVTATVSQKKGKKAYTASYSAGDCRSWKAKRSVTVR